MMIKSTMTDHSIKSGCLFPYEFVLMTKD